MSRSPRPRTPTPPDVAHVVAPESALTSRVASQRYGAATAANYDAIMAEPLMRRRWQVIDSGLVDAARGCERVLSLGCGTGRLMQKFEARLVVGVDCAPGMLQCARDKGISGLVLADAHALPFASGSFDAVLAGNGVFRYLDQDRALRECARVLRPGGRLAIHHYAARLWTRGPRARRAQGDDHGMRAAHLGSVRDLTAPAAALGLRCERVRLYRPVRRYPYALPIPSWLPGHLWLHCVVVLCAEVR